MIPNMNPAQMKKLMQQMGIKNTEIPAVKVTVEKNDGTVMVVENPQVLMIEMGGNKSLQVSGEFREGNAGDKSKGESEKSDVDIIMEQVPSASKTDAEAALKKSNGDIAEAIMLLEAKR